MVDHTGDRGRVLLLMWVAEGGGVGRLIFVEFHRVDVEFTGILSSSHRACRVDRDLVEQSPSKQGFHRAVTKLVELTGILSSSHHARRVNRISSSNHQARRAHRVPRVSDGPAKFV